MSIGQPPKYKDEYAKMLLDYVGVKPYEIKRVERVTAKGVESLEIEVPADFPSFSGFAIQVQVSRDTLLNWAKSGKYPEWTRAYNLAKDYMAHFFTVNGAKGHISGHFAQILAVNVLGWRQKAEGEEDRTITHAGELRVKKIDLDERVEQLRAGE